MNVLDDLVPLIDNGGQRAYAKRRCNLRFRLIPERRANSDRRKIIDRRTLPNERRMTEPERRVVFKG
jgi:hypothetical protein